MDSEKHILNELRSKQAFWLNLAKFLLNLTLILIKILIYLVLLAIVTIITRFAILLRISVVSRALGPCSYSHIQRLRKTRIFQSKS